MERASEATDALPEYNSHGDVLNRYWRRLVEERPEYQFAVYEGDEPLARAHTLPLRWDGTVADLPDGIDGAVQRGFDEGGANVLCALLIEVATGEQGKGLSRVALQAMGALARKHGLEALIAPVRPNWKERYPLVPIDRYAAWRRDDGLPFDPWMRVHERLGAGVLKPEPRSLRHHRHGGRVGGVDGDGVSGERRVRLPARARRRGDRPRGGRRRVLGAERMDAPFGRVAFAVDGRAQPRPRRARPRDPGLVHRLALLVVVGGGGSAGRGRRRPGRRPGRYDAARDREEVLLRSRPVDRRELTRLRATILDDRADRPPTAAAGSARGRFPGRPYRPDRCALVPLLSPTWPSSAGSRPWAAATAAGLRSGCTTSSTGRAAGWNSDARFPAASTVKVALLAAALRAIEVSPERSPHWYDLRQLSRLVVQPRRQPAARVARERARCRRAPRPRDVVEHLPGPIPRRDRTRRRAEAAAAADLAVHDGPRSRPGVVRAAGGSLRQPLPAAAAPASRAGEPDWRWSCSWPAGPRATTPAW